MNTQRSESLSSTLGEADIGERSLVGRFKDVTDRIRDVMKCKVVHREIPELGGVGRVVDVLL